MSWKLAPSFRSISRLLGTLAFRLTAAYTLAGLVLVFIATASLYVVLVSELEKSTNQFLADKENVLRTMLRERPDDEDALREEVELETAARRYQQFYIRVSDDENRTILMTPGMSEQLDSSQVARQAITNSAHATSIRGKNGHALRVAIISAPVGSSSAHNDIIQIAIDVSQTEDLLARYRLGIGTILLGTFGILPLIGYQIARHGIAPVEEMATTARHITSTNLRERILTHGYTSELASLASTFNEMLDRLEESFERISRFSADIAHDLRTPVNNIRGEAEVALARPRSAEEYQDVIGSFLEEAVRLSDLISDLLFLARAESPLRHLRRERVEVGELLGGMMEYYEASAADGGISLFKRASEQPVNAEVDRTLMQRAVANLVSNALANTPSGGQIILSACIDNSTVRIEVSDSGIGIPAEALPRVFDRFFRVDSARSQSSGGTGLGLSIVQSIAVLPGGHVEISSQLGQGTQVILHIPISVTN
jgi:two-component system heavy metal sensor histidine kinase CusS